MAKTKNKSDVNPSYSALSGLTLISYYTSSREEVPVRDLIAPSRQEGRKLSPPGIDQTTA